MTGYVRMDQESEPESKMTKLRSRAEVPQEGR
jgi:hypothetical protein